MLLSLFILLGIDPITIHDHTRQICVALAVVDRKFGSVGLARLVEPLLMFLL